MEHAGGSWPFTESVNETAHVALYVRDVLGLDVAATPDRVPALDGALPSRSDVLNDAARQEAAAH